MPDVVARRTRKSTFGLHLKCKAIADLYEKEPSRKTRTHYTKVNVRYLSTILSFIPSVWRIHVHLYACQGKKYNRCVLAEGQIFVYQANESNARQKETTFQLSVSTSCVRRKSIVLDSKSGQWSARANGNDVIYTFVHAHLAGCECGGEFYHTEWTEWYCQQYAIGIRQYSRLPEVYSRHWWCHRFDCIRKFRKGLCSFGTRMFASGGHLHLLRWQEISSDMVHSLSKGSSSQHFFWVICWCILDLSCKLGRITGIVNLSLSTSTIKTKGNRIKTYWTTTYHSYG